MRSNAVIWLRLDASLKCLLEDATPHVGRPTRRIEPVLGEAGEDPAFEPPGDASGERRLPVARGDAHRLPEEVLVEIEAPAGERPLFARSAGLDGEAQLELQIASYLVIGLRRIGGTEERVVC